MQDQVRRQRCQMVPFQCWPELLRGFAVKFGEDRREGHLGDNLLLVRVGEQGGGGEVEGEEEERRHGLLYICEQASAKRL